MFYTASLSAVGVCCIACTISAFYVLVPQLTSCILKSTIKHQLICYGETFEGRRVLQCIRSSDAFCRDNRVGVFAIHSWILFLFISNATYSCAGLLLLPRAPQAHTDTATYAAAGEHYPSCFQHPHCHPGKNPSITAI